MFKKILIINQKEWKRLSIIKLSIMEKEIFKCNYCVLKKSRRILYVN